MKLSDRKRLWQYCSTVMPLLPSHAVIIRGGLPLRPREADNCPCILFRTQTHQTPVFHLPTSPLLGGLIADVNSTLARLVEDQTSGFIPFPMKWHQRFYHTAAPSLSAPYVVPPSLASLTREKPGDHKRSQIHLPYSVLTGLESALAGIDETMSRLDWWLSTVSIPRGSPPLGTDQLREDPLIGIESPRHRRQPGSPSPG